jgi:type VI secretion system protein ImpH
VWAKYRLVLQVLEENNPPQIERLFCFVGLGEPSLRENVASPLRLLRYIGLLSQFPRSAVGLQTLLRDALDGIPVQVISCIRRIAKIPDDQLLCLGASGCSLGHNSYLGNQMRDRMGKFRIQLGPLTRHEFHRFAPGTEAYDWLNFLTDLYTLEPLEYDVELIMAPEEVRSVRLGDPERTTLGVDSWIFSGEKWGEVRAVFKPQRR